MSNRRLPLMEDNLELNTKEDDLKKKSLVYYSINLQDQFSELHQFQIKGRTEWKTT